MKLFDEDEDDGTLDKCTLREVSMMRYLRGSKNGHPGVLNIHDIVVMEDKMCLVMEKFACNVNDAIEKKLFKSPKGRVRFAHKLLCAIAFLHDNGIMHRDIKGDNIMITKSGDPVLIDFSLSKFVADAEVDTIRESKTSSTNRLHTGDSGSATYMAPEVYRNEGYCEKCDMYSTGIVLLEIIQGENLPVDKDKAAFKYVQDVKEKLPKRPFPELVRKLLESDPCTRASAREALSSGVFAKNGLEVPPVRSIDPVDVAVGNTKLEYDDKMKRRMKKMYNDLECENPKTLSAALAFATRCGVETNEDCEVSMEHCLILAMKLYEQSCYDLEDPEDLDDALDDDFEAFDIDHYHESEFQIFQAMEYCLYVVFERVFYHFKLFCFNCVGRISFASLMHTARKNHSKKSTLECELDYDEHRYDFPHHSGDDMEKKGRRKKKKKKGKKKK